MSNDFSAYDPFYNKFSPLELVLPCCLTLCYVILVLSSGIIGVNIKDL